MRTRMGAPLVRASQIVPGSGCWSAPFHCRRRTWRAASHRDEGVDLAYHPQRIGQNARHPGVKARDGRLLESLRRYRQIRLVWRHLMIAVELNGIENYTSF